MGGFLLGGNGSKVVSIEGSYLVDSMSEHICMGGGSSSSSLESSG